MSVQRFKVRDPRHLSSPRAPSPIAPTAPCNPPPAAAPASLATAIMANSVEGPAPQPSKQPAGAEAEAVAAAKEERRLSEPVPKKRRLLQATEAEQAPGGQDVPEDILAQVINAVGIDSNLAESEVEELPPVQPAEEVAGLQYLKEVRPLPPGMPLSPRMRAPDPRVRLAYPPQYAPLEGHYAVREVRHPYPYTLRPHDLGAPPPPYRHYFPRHYLREPLPPAQALTRLPVVRAPGPEHLPPQHGAPGVPRHLRPPPLHPSPTGSPTEVRHVLAPPPHPGLPGPNPGNPTRVYPGGPLGRPELPVHLREVRVPFHALPGAPPYPHMRARVPEGLTRLAYDPRDPGRELGPHQVVVASHYPPGGPLPPRPVYSPDRHPGADPTWRPQPTEEGALRPPRRIIELPSPCVELIPIGPRRSSTTSSPSAEGRQGSDPDNPPASTHATGPKPLAEGPESRRQSAPVLSVQPVRPPLAQRSFSSDTPRGPPEPAAPVAEARRSSDPVVTNASASAHEDEHGHVSGEEDATEKNCEEDTRPSSTNSDITIEKVVLVNPGSGVVLPRLGLPRLGQPAAPSEGRKAASREKQPPSGDAGEVETRTEQSTVSSEVGEAPSQAVESGCGGDGSRAPAANLNARRPASEPPPGSTPSQVTRQRPASLPAPGTTPRPCPEGDDNASSEDAVFMERLQLVLSDLLSVPEATQLQELSCSPARLLSTLVRRCGVQPSANPELKKRLREDFKTMVQLCMPPALIQDFGWESCTSEQILTQLLRLSHNGEDVNRRTSLSSYVLPDDALEDDVFSPPTPHAPPHTPQLSHTHPQPPQPLQPSPQASHSSQAHPQPSLPSKPPPLTSQPSHPSPQKSQPSHPPPQTSQPSPTHPRSSKASHPPPLTSQPSLTHPQTPQPSQTHPKPSQPSHPLPQTSEPSQQAPQTSQPSQTHSEPSQPSQTKSQTSSLPSTHPQTSQSSQTHSQPSQPSQTQPKTSQPSQSPTSSSQPCHSHPQPSKPSQTHPQTTHPSHPPPSSSQPSPTHPKSSQPSHPSPSTSQPSVNHPQTSTTSHPTHPSPQSSHDPQHPPASSSHSFQPSQNPPRVVKPSQPSPQKSQPSQPTPASSHPSAQVSKASPQVSKPSHPTPPSSILSSIRQAAPRPSLLPLTPLEHQYIPSSPTYHPASPSHHYQHLPPSSHPSHPPPLNPQPGLHTSHPPLRLPAASTSFSSSHLPSPTSQASHVIASTRPSHLPPLTSTASHLPPQGSESHLHKSSHSPSSTSHPPHHLPASPSQPQHPMSRPSHLPPSPTHTTRSSPLISPISPPPPTYITLVPSSRASHLPSHASSPSSSSSPTLSPSPSHSHIPVSSPSHVQPPRAPQYLPHVSQGAHLPQLVPHSTHIQPHASMPTRYPDKMDDFEYTTQLQYYLQTAPRPGFSPQHYAIHRPPVCVPVPHPRVGGRKEIPAPPVPGKDGVIRHNHQHQQQQPHPPHPPPPHPPPRLVLRHSPPPPPSHVRLTSEKWLGNDGVVRPAAYPSTNGQVSPTSKSLPT